MTVPTPPFTYARIVRAVTFIASAPERVKSTNTNESVKLGRLLDKQARMLRVAALREIGTPCPSWTDVGGIIGCAHSVAMADWERWSALNWRDRSNWLDLVERVIVAQAEESYVEAR